MRRVKFACLEQTLHFAMREPLSPEETERTVRIEYEQYKKDLERKHVQYKIDSEDVQPDGSLIVRIKKQYNAHELGEYLK